MNEWMNEWMNECLMTPKHEKQIGYRVSEKGKCMKWLLYVMSTHMIYEMHLYYISDKKEMFKYNNLYYNNL